MIISYHRVQHTPSTVYPQYSIHRVQPTLSTAYTKYSIHRVQHTPSTVYTEYSITWVLHTPCTALSEDRLSPAPSQSYLSADPVVLNSLHWHNYELTNEWIESPLLSHLPPKHTASRLTASKYASNLARSWPWSASSSSLDRSFQVHLQSGFIIAFNCISNLAQMQPPSASPNSLNCGPQVHHQTCSITALECILEFTRSLFSGTLWSWARLSVYFVYWDVHLRRGHWNIYCPSLSPSPLFVYLRMYIYRDT
jgi:hypothetical protein